MNYTFLGIFLTACVTSLLMSCIQHSTHQKLSPEAFDEKLHEAGPTPALIDVRTAEEYNSGRLEGAINLDYNDPDFESNILQINKTKPVFVYCEAGGRSREAAEILHKAGFNEVYDLQGGIIKWAKDGKPVVK